MLMFKNEEHPVILIVCSDHDLSTAQTRPCFFKAVFCLVREWQ